MQLIEPHSSSLQAKFQTKGHVGFYLKYTILDLLPQDNHVHKFLLLQYQLHLNDVGSKKQFIKIIFD